MNRFLLLRQRQRPIQRAKIGIVRHLAGQSLQHPIDLRHARQEQQQRPRLFGQQPLYRRRYAILQPLMAGQRLIQTLNREAAPLGHHHRRFRQQLRQASVVQGGRHDQQFQIVTQPLLHIEQQRQRQIGLQAAFVELIEDHQRHALQFGVLLQHAGENAFRHHFQPGLRPAFTFGAHAVAHGLAGFLPQLLRQAIGDVFRRQPPRLQHDNAPRQPGLSQDLQRQPGGFTGAGRGVQQHLRSGLQRSQQLIKHRADGQ